MANFVKIKCVGGSYKHDSLPFDSQETTNLFPETGGPSSKSPAIFRRTPGLKSFTSLTGTGAVRQLYETSTLRLFGSRSTNFSEILADGTETIRGSLSSTYDRISMTDNGFELGVADGTHIYSFDLTTNTLSTVSGGSPPSNTPILEFIDGYVFGFDPDADIIGSFQHSNLNDLTTWNGLDVYTSEGLPDKLVTLKAHNGKLWAFGSKGFEVFYNTKLSTPGDTWAIMPGTLKNIGCGAVHSVSVMAGQIFWLGSSKDGENIIWTADGYQPRRISTRAQESEIEKFATVSDAWSFTFEYLGHFFYALTFQTGNRTFLYDITEGEWVNWAYRDTVMGTQGRHRAVCHAFSNRKNLVGDYLNGNIYELDRYTYTDNGDPIVWERYFPYVHSMNKRVTIYSLFIDFLTGQGLLNSQGSDPKVQIRWSINGGRTYGNWHQMGLGERGEYFFQAIQRMMGMARSWVFHIRSSEPIPMSIQDNTIAKIKVKAS